MSKKRILSNGYSHDYRLDKVDHKEPYKTEWDSLMDQAIKECGPQDEFQIVVGPEYLKAMDKALSRYLVTNKFK